METLVIDGPPNWLEPSEQQGLLHQGWEEGIGASDSVVGPKAERKLTFLLVFGSQCQLWSLSPQILTLLFLLLLPQLGTMLGQPWAFSFRHTCSHTWPREAVCILYPLEAKWN